MSTPQQDIESVEAALRAMGERAASDPEYRRQLVEDHVSELASAGVSALTLTESLVEVDATEAEVQAFGMNPLNFADISGGGRGGRDPEPLILSQACIGTCINATIWICGSCTNSYKAP